MPFVAHAPDYVPILRGECMGCGKCCQVEHDGETFSCSHLVLLGQGPYPTRCSVHADRVDGMPIIMTAPSGRTLPGRCAAHNTDEERRTIIARGIASGFCSLEVVK